MHTRSGICNSCERAFAIQKHNWANQLFHRRSYRDYELFSQLMLYLKIPGFLLSFNYYFYLKITFQLENTSVNALNLHKNKVKML